MSLPNEMKLVYNTLDQIRFEYVGSKDTYYIDALKNYQTTLETWKWQCTCPDFVYRKEPTGRRCKHILHCIEVLS